jgi:hypothetical protein
MPSWDNKFGPIKKPGWLGIHTLDGRIAPGHSSQKLDFVENDEDDSLDNGPERGVDWIYDGSLEVYPDPTAPAGTQRSLVLWVASASGFGVSIVQNVGATGTTTGPADVTVDANHSVTLSGTFEGAGSPLLYQFQKDDGTGKFVDVPGSWGNLARFGHAGKTVSFTIASAKPSDSGKYRFWVGNTAGKVVSAVATVTVNADTTAPQVTSVSSLDGANVDILFNELLDAASAGNAANYTLSGGATASSAAIRPNGKSVRLSGVAGLSASFSVTVKGVADIAGNPIAAPGQTVSGSVQGYTAVDVNVPDTFPGTSFSDADGSIEVEAGGSDIWNNADNFHFVYKERSGDFDVKVQVADNARPSNRNGIMARETTDADSINVFQGWNPDAGFISSVRRTAATGPNWWSDAKNWVPNPCAADKTIVTPPNIWLRLKRQGSTFTGYHSTDGVNWVQDGSSDVDIADPVLLGLGSNVGGNGQAYSHTTFANFTDVSSLAISPAAAGKLALSWFGAGTLESAPSITGPWTTAADQSNPQTITPSATTFYRLR